MRELEELEVPTSRVLELPLDVRADDATPGHTAPVADLHGIDRPGEWGRGEQQTRRPNEQHEGEGDGDQADRPPPRGVDGHMPRRLDLEAIHAAVSGPA
jgi:hypothetical protein